MPEGKEMEKIILNILSKFEKKSARIITPSNKKVMVPYTINNQVHYRWEVKELAC